MIGVVIVDDIDDWFGGFGVEDYVVGFVEVEFWVVGNNVLKGFGDKFFEWGKEVLFGYVGC